MKAILLAAGRGSRMRHLTEASPKCLVELQGRPLLEWQLESLCLAGITQVAIVTGYRRELLADYGLVEFHNPRWAQTNMLSSLACAEAWLASEPCVVSYTDIFYQPQAVRGLMESSAPLAVSYDPEWRKLWEKRFVEPLSDAETFRLDASGHLIEIGGRPCNVETIQGQYMGLLRFTPEGWAEASCIRGEVDEAQRDAMHMTGALQRIIEAGRLPVAAVAYHGSWGEIDSESDLYASADAAHACITAIEHERAEVRRQSEIVAQDIYPHNCQAMHRPRGKTIWITGLSGSGKSTTAYAVEANLLAAGIACQVLDGDNLRHGINKDLGFTQQDRSENIRRTAEIAKLFNDAGLVVIVSLISPLIRDRELARSIIGEGNFLEVFMSTPIGVCEQRDPKGLYKKARLGQIQNFTGVTSPYQAPSNPDIRISSEAATPEDIAATIITGIL
ncbi:adenylyl-sulfate kinase [Ectopseudomonas mendocina]